MPTTPRTPGGGVALAFTLAFALGCTRAPERVRPLPDPAAPLAAATSVAPPATPGSAPTDGAALPPPPSPEDHNLFGLVRSASDLAQQGIPPVASPDGERVAFVQPDGKKGKPSLWVSRKDGAQARKLFDVETAKVENAPDGMPLAETSGIFDLSFSPDGKKIYFQADGWATSLALYVVEIDGAKVRFVHDANGYAVLHACKDEQQVGRIIILQHSYFNPIPTSAVDWYFLIDEDGDKLGIVGPDQANVDRFLAKRCGAGAAPADPPKAEIPPRLRRRRLDCGGYRIEPNPIDFLDGTRLDLFFATDKESLKTEEHPLPEVLYLDDAEAFLDANCPAGRKL